MGNKSLLKRKLIESVAANILLLDSSEDEDDLELIGELEDDLGFVSLLRYSYENIVPKNFHWFRSTSANYDNDRFKIMMRMNRNQFNLVLDLIKDHEVFHGNNSHKQFTPFFQLCLVLYRLGSSGEAASRSKIAALFGIGDGGTIEKITDRVFKAILMLRTHFLSWPTSQERIQLIEETMDELPHCIGYVDGSDIPLAEAPTLDPVSYFSGKKEYSLKLQGICDKNHCIRHIVVGYPGSVHDAKIFNNSSIGMNPENFLWNDEYIAGDSAYRLTTYVITPFRKSSKTETAEIRKKFNKKFSKYRVRIEHCFEFLKEKFNSLKCLKLKIYNAESHKKACLWITVCCILHNIILPIWDEDDFKFFSVLQQQENYIDIDEQDETVINDKLGELKREALLNIIL